MKEIRAVKAIACIAQSVERQPFKLVVVGSSPTVGVSCCSRRQWRWQYWLPGSVCRDDSPERAEGRVQCDI